MNPHELIDNGFAIPAVDMRPYWRVRFLAPAGEIDARFDEKPRWRRWYTARLIATRFAPCLRTSIIGRSKVHPLVPRAKLASVPESSRCRC